MKKLYIIPQVEITEGILESGLCELSVKATWGGKDTDKQNQFVNDIGHNEGYEYATPIDVFNDNGELDSRANGGLWEN